MAVSTCPPRDPRTGPQARCRDPIHPRSIHPHFAGTPYGLKPPVATNVKIIRAGRSGEQRPRIPAPLPRSEGNGGGGGGPYWGKVIRETGSAESVLIVGRLSGGDWLGDDSNGAVAATQVGRAARRPDRSHSSGERTARAPVSVRAAAPVPCRPRRDCEPARRQGTRCRSASERRIRPGCYGLPTRRRSGWATVE